MARIAEADIGDKILGGTDLSMAEMLASTGVNHLQWVAKLCGCTTATHANWANSDFAQAFTRSGVDTFEDLILLGSNDINDLSYPGQDPTGAPAMLKIPPVKIVLLRFYLHLYHRQLRLDKEKAHPLVIDQEAMKSVRTKSEVNPHAEILPWYAPDKTSADMKRDWQRSVKRDAKQFPILKKDHMFLMFKEGFIDSAKAQYYAATKGEQVPEAEGPAQEEGIQEAQSFKSLSPLHPTPCSEKASSRVIEHDIGTHDQTQRVVSPIRTDPHSIAPFPWESYVSAPLS